MTTTETSTPAAAAGDRRPLLQAEHLVKHFPITRGIVFRRKIGEVQAVDDVSFSIESGETLSLVGESGCGKSTTARLVLRLIPPTSGTVHLDGVDLGALDSGDLRRQRRNMQLVFQDPYASLNPRMTVGDIVGEPLQVWHEKTGRRARVAELLEQCGLRRTMAGRYPHELSGGQRQRVGIARALALHPKLVVCDEPVSALDVSVRAQILNLLSELQTELHLAYLFIAHDLAVVRHISDRVAVMYLGKIVEQGTRDDIYEHPSHPYTQALLSAIPVPDPGKERVRERIMLTGEVPSPANPPSGCRFRTRCWKATEKCAEEEPALIDRGQGHPVACHYAEEREIV